MDGYDKESNIVYEFQGCFWHGCTDCYKNRTEKHRRLEDRSMASVYECMQAKVHTLSPDCTDVGVPMEKDERGDKRGQRLRT